MATLSVVIPCYNRRGTIGRSLESVLAQTAPVDEIIVVDDGSRDDSAEVAESFGPKVRVIRTENRGAAAARNRGIREARGEWIAFLDSDDYWHPAKIAKQLAAVRRFPSAKLIFCDTRSSEGENVIMPSRFALGGLRGQEVEQQGNLAVYDRRLFTAMLESSRVITSAVMVRRDLPELIFPEHIWGSEDWGLWLTLAARYTFASVDEILVEMYVVGDNLTRNISKIMRNDLLVLEDLQRDAQCTSEEQREIARVHAARRVAAVYHSLLRGEGSHVRLLLAGESRVNLPTRKQWLYYAASFLPAFVLKSMAARSQR